MSGRKPQIKSLRNDVAVPITAVLGWFLVISLCYGIVDPSALPGPTGLVVSQVHYDICKKFQLADIVVRYCGIM